MYKFHIIGYEGKGANFWSNCPVDIKVFAKNRAQAIDKAESILGNHISTSGRKIVIEEMVGEG